MLTSQEEQEERRRQQAQQGGTFFSHSVSQAAELSGGRYGAAMGAPSVTGATPIPNYAAAGVHQSDPVGTEPPLGVDVNEMPPLESSTGLSAVEATGGAVAPSCPSGVEPAPPPSSEQTNE